MSLKNIQLEITEINKYILAFYKNPFLNVKKVPAWSWLSLIILIGLFSSITGVLRGLIAGSGLQALIGFLFLPITALLLVFMLSCFFYFLIVVFQNRNLNFKRLTTLTFVASIPTITMYALSLIHPAVFLIGCTFSFALLAFGLIHRFQLTKKFVWISMGCTYLFIVLLLTLSYMNFGSNKKAKKIIDSESKKILQKELAD